MRLMGIANFWIIGVVPICYLLTWLEAVLGFRVGCWMYSLLFDCEVCEVPYRRSNEARASGVTHVTVSHSARRRAKL